MKSRVTDIARKQIALYLHETRRIKGIKTKQLSETSGLETQVIKAIEEGNTTYSIEDFMNYISAVECYFYIADKGGRELNLTYLLDQMKNSA